MKMGVHDWSCAAAVVLCIVALVVPEVIACG